MTSAGVAAEVEQVVRRLRPLLAERLLRPVDRGYETARALWNAAVARRPALIARCLRPAEVAACVDAAREAGLPLSVRAGGHDWAGRALTDGGLVIDVTGMAAVTVHPGPATATTADATATVGGGATAGALLSTASRDGLVTPTGVVRAVGLAGLTMAGGYGPLIGRLGLALDNLLSADLVLADGTSTRAAPDADAELFWALRGGGGNFGVVTSLTYRLHRGSTVLAGMLMFPLAEARQVLAGYRELVASAPDELSVMAGFLPGPGGHVPFLCPFYSGPDPATGQRLIDQLGSLGHPVVAQVATMPYHDALGMFDGSMVEGNHYRLRTRWLPDLPADAVETLLDAVRTVSSPFSAIALHHFHGAASRVPVGDTAFGLRRDHLLAEVISVWRPGEPAEPHHAWGDAVVAGLAPFTLPGGYPNLLGPDEGERVRAAYGPNLDRLLAAKRRYDPDGVFASAVPGLPTQP